MASRACNRSTFFAILSFLLLKIVYKKILGHLVGNAVALRQIMYGLQEIRAGAAFRQQVFFFDKFIPKNIQNYFVGGKRNNRMIARMLCAVLESTSGEVLLDGKEVTSMGAHN